MAEAGKTRSTRSTRTGGKLQALPPTPAQAHEAELAARRRYTLTGDDLMAQAGPAVIPVWLPMAGSNVLMRRVRVADMVANGALPQPLTEVVATMCRAGQPTEEQLTADRYAETVAAMRAIAMSCLVLPPAQFFTDPDWQLSDLTHEEAAKLTPLLVPVDKAPGPGQAPATILHDDDLKETVRCAIKFGPAALFVFRKGPAAAVEGVQDS